MDVEWLDLEELEEKEDIEMCEAEKRWLEVKSKECESEGIKKLDNRNQVKIKKISMIFHGFYCTLKIPLNCKTKSH